MKKVMITGIGMLTAVGNGKAATWESVKAGKSGIGRITKFDPSRCTCQVAAELKGFDEYAIGSGLLDKKDARKMANFSKYAVTAAVEAWKDAGFARKGVEGDTGFQPDMDRVGTMLGNGIGGLDVTEDAFKTLFDRGPDRLSPLAIPELIANEGAGNIAIALGAKGPCQVVVTACASSTDALGFALDMIRAGRADVMIAGGAEGTIMEFCVGGFMKEKALATKFNDTPEKACRPFNVDRDGFVMGEGCGIVVLESLEHAKARGAHIYAEMAGYGANSDAYHITSPAPHGTYQAKCMQLALDDAGMKAADVDYVNAHGTSTHLNDQGETEAIKAVWGDAAKDVSVSSIKSMTGHLLGAAGGVECIATALAVENDMLPPTINYETPEEGLDLDYVPNKAKAKTVRAAMSNSFGFGGHNACLLLKKYAE